MNDRHQKIDSEKPDLRSETRQVSWVPYRRVQQEYNSNGKVKRIADYQNRLSPVEIQPNTEEDYDDCGEN